MGKIVLFGMLGGFLGGVVFFGIVTFIGYFDGWRLAIVGLVLAGVVVGGAIGGCCCSKENSKEKEADES